MSDLIRRVDAILCVVWGENVKDVCDKIEALPTVEAESVVRCKDCKHWTDFSGDCLQI